MLQLGRDLATGDKLPKDVEQAARWIQLAAATGNAEGMFELGRFYRDGVGLAQDSVRAYAWFSRAAAANHLTAMHERDEMVRTMSEEKLKEAHQLSLTAEPVADTVRRK
jgi:TPR repeat protein